MHDPDMSSEIRSEYARVVSELASLPSTEFALRAPLILERDQLAAQLRTCTDVDQETLDRWAERAGSRPSTEATPFVDPGPGEGGGGAV